MDAQYLFSRIARLSRVTLKPLLPLHDDIDDRVTDEAVE